MKITKRISAIYWTDQNKNVLWKTKLQSSLLTDSSTYVTGTGASFITVLAIKEELRTPFDQRGKKVIFK